MKEWLKTLEEYTSSSILWFTIFICLIVIVVNCKYIIKLESTIDTMWHEIEQVKETNIDMYQFIEEHKNDFD